MKNSKTLDQVQKEVDTLIRDIGGYWEPFQLLTAIIEELGELAKELQLKHGLRPKEKESKLLIEVGDLLFTIICFANAQGISLEKSIEKTLEKYRERDRKKWLRKLDGTSRESRDEEWDH